MGILRSDGFPALVRAVMEECRVKRTVADAAHHAASLGDRTPINIGLQALTSAESHLLEVAVQQQAELIPPSTGDTLALTLTGRLRLVPDGAEVPAADYQLGSMRWPNGRPTALTEELISLSRSEEAEDQELKAWLSTLPRAEVDAMIEEVRFCLLHMAPVLLYVGNRHYTNLGKPSNLIGKSLKADSPHCALNGLERTPVEDWNATDACFLVCVHALSSSGPAVRVEEFNGVQLRPDRLESFLLSKLTDYDAEIPSTEEMAPAERLHVLAKSCALGRNSALSKGKRAYRVIRGLNLNKQEHLTEEPVQLAHVPPVVTETMAAHLGVGVPADFAELREACAKAMPLLHTPGEEGFTSRFEQALHDVVLSGTEATNSDVGMSRGPRRISALSNAINQHSLAPLDWGTNAFYCCVTPSSNFVRRFAEAPAELPQALRAIGARMRYNGWHYLPHSSGMHHRAAERDWFFAPTMSDVTDWSDQHHTGHVAHGVRYAIRVPFGIELAGANRPGVHDFRLMRAWGGEPYTIADLRSAIAIGELLRVFYQAHADHLASGAPALDVVDFDNSWYQSRYNDLTELILKEETHV